MDLVVEGMSISAFHATPHSLFEVVQAGATDELLQEKLMAAKEADLYVYAHIHKPYIRYMEGKVLMNIGSVGLPFDGIAKASYAIVDVHQGAMSTSIRRVPYDVEEVVRQYEAGDYPNAEMMSRIVRRGRLN
jgi:predicted phosphodiesterase